MTVPAIEFRQVTKIYRRFRPGHQVPALSAVSFSVSPGEVCAFLGPNGAGKTTSINLLMGFLYADKGEIRVLGYAPGDIRAKQQIGFLPENFSFYKYLNASRLLRLHSAMAGLHSEQSSKRISELLGRVHLQDYPHLKIGKYSRGMVQRLGLAQALLSDPQLLVFDEPTSGLDPAGRKEVRDLILALKSTGKTIFLSSHLLAEVEQICDRVIIINRGQMVRAASLAELRGTGNRVEILVDVLPEPLRPALAEMGAAVEAGTHGVRIIVDIARKRALLESLWSAGSDVIRLTPINESLEDMYLQLTENSGGPA